MRVEVYAKEPLVEKRDCEKVIFWDCETTGLLNNVEKSSVVSITFLASNGRRISAVGDAEGYILQLAFSVFMQYPDCLFVGYNTEQFDIPFITKRAEIIKYPEEEIALPTWNLDLFHVVNKDRQGKWLSLSEACKYYGTGVHIKYSGKEVPELVKEGKWSKVLEHNIEDVVATKALYEALIKAGTIEE